jgi:hypothetical protein
MVGGNVKAVGGFGLWLWLVVASQWVVAVILDFLD